MSKKLQILTRAGLLMGLFLAFASAQNHYVVDAPAANIKDLCSRYGFQYVTSLSGSAQGLYVVNSPLGLGSIQQALLHEPTVKNVELDLPLSLPEASKTAAPEAGWQGKGPSTPGPIGTLDGTGVKPPSAVTYADDASGASAWTVYLNQPAATMIKVSQAHNQATGSGIVAMLDTGADFTHPVLKNSLIWGYDFINNIPMGQALPVDLNQSTTSILDQSTTSILDQSTTSILDLNSTVILNQSTTSILDQSTTSILDGTRPINDWGHGTMVAGLIHLVAPTAELMPVKVFDAQGGSSISLIVQGIYYAVDSGARVINMSFSMTGASQVLKNAIDFANSRGVILVAAAGNEGKDMLVYPGGYVGEVISVGATDNNGVRAPFSNFGSIVTLAAPGINVITTYPQNRYAAGSGTSFSAPLVAGAAALFIQFQPGINEAGALQAVDHAHPLNGQLLGAGLLDLLQACSGLH